MRIIITIIAFAATMGVFFISGQFHGFSPQKTSEQTIAVTASSTPLSTTRPKTATILNSIKNLIVPSSTGIPTPTIASSTTPSPTNNLPSLQRLSPTPTPSSLPSPIVSPASTPSPSNTPEPTPTPSSTPEASTIPSPTPSQTSESIYIASTMPLVYKQKADAQLQIQTYPQASCGIKVTWPSGNLSTAQSLSGQQTADSSGFITWTWGVNWNTKVSPPAGKIVLNCTYDSQSYSKSVDFTVTTP